MIDIRNLTKTFGPRQALADVSLSVEPGERVMLVGPNGAGKTTLLRILATLSRPTSGTVCIGGYDTRRSGAEVRALIGYLSHETLLYNDLTARQNLQFYARMYALGDADSRIDELLSRVDLTRRADDLVGTFSRGMQQRLAVARSILHGPQLLLLDEPYTGLDPMAADTLTELLTDLVTAGRTLVLTTHHPLAEGRLAQRVLILRSGRVIYDAALDNPETFPFRYRALVTEKPRRAEATV
ncbi:MAG: heme ABC exporter ATP-binding protein CcmA [Anaerolineae bacterium]